MKDGMPLVSYEQTIRFGRQVFKLDFGSNDSPDSDAPRYESCPKVETRVWLASKRRRKNEEI